MKVLPKNGSYHNRFPYGILSSGVPTRTAIYTVTEFLFFFPKSWVQHAVITSVPALLYGFETLSLTFKEEHRLAVFEKRLNWGKDNRGMERTE